MSNTENYFDPNTGEVEGDRGVPQVEKSGVARLVLIVFFIGFCVLAIFGIEHPRGPRRVRVATHQAKAATNLPITGQLIDR